MTAAFDTGFSVRQAMWHGQGSVLADAPQTVDEFLLAAGLTWEPEDETMYQLRTELDGSAPEGSQPISQSRTGDGFATYAVPVEGRKLIVRSDTRAVLGTPSDGYARILNRDMVEVMEAVAQESAGKVVWETGGAAEGGRLTWAVARLDEPYTVGKLTDDPIYPYITGLNQHDGGGAMRVVPTEVRVVCRNTWNAALMTGEKSGRVVTVRHAGSNVASRLDDAKKIVAALRSEAAASKAMADELDAIHVSDEVVEAFLDDFIPPGDNMTAKGVEARRRKRAGFMALYNGLTPDAEKTQGHLTGTAWGLVSAAIEWLDHARPARTQEVYLRRTIFHQGEAPRIKARVLDRVRELAHA